MKKVLDSVLEKKIKNMKPADVIALFRELQDAGGLKVCQVITEGDPAVREVN